MSAIGMVRVLSLVVIASCAATAAMAQGTEKEGRGFAGQPGWFCTQWSYGIPAIGGMTTMPEAVPMARWMCTQWTFLGVSPPGLKSGKGLDEKKEGEGMGVPPVESR